MGYSPWFRAEVRDTGPLYIQAASGGPREPELVQRGREKPPMAQEVLALVGALAGVA